MERIPAPGFTQVNEPARRQQQVRVPNREEVGEVVDPGKNIGGGIGMYCVAVHFPSTGEVIYYDKNRVEYIN
jgi:hypothetical protein